MLGRVVQSRLLSLVAATHHRLVISSSRLFSAQPAPSEGNESLTVKVNDFKLHDMSESPPTEVQTSRSELLYFFERMFYMRRMELTADQLYKTKAARGFLHLADGQEAVPVGMEAAIDFQGQTDLQTRIGVQDSIMQTYRDHTTFVGRGGTAKEVFAELMGRVGGAARGLGGSMHLYKKEHGFYGGQGIVGSGVPLGVGHGFMHKYNKDGHVAFSIYGDGAANQGQVFEAFNIAALWQIPVIFVVENNHYGMGTAERRASKSAEFFRRGNYIPGIWVDGMDVLAVKSATAFAKQWVLEKGPLVLEMDTYRYHGHSISDPGSSYRTRDEVQGVRRARDPIEHVRTLLVEHGLAESQELKQLERKIKKQIDAELKEARESPEPPIEDLWNNIYVDGLAAKLRPVEVGKPKIQL